MNLSYLTIGQLRDALCDASRKLAFVRSTINNIPDMHVPFLRLQERDFLERCIKEYRAETLRRWTEGVPLRIYYSYSRQDEALLKKLDSTLSSLKSQKLIETFWDYHMEPGVEWESVNNEKLSNSDMILFLVTPAFLASHYCQKVELPVSLELQSHGLIRLVPILIQPCEWQETILSRFQIIPRNCKPITDWPDQTEAWSEVASSLVVAIEQLRKAGPDFDFTQNDF